MNIDTGREFPFQNPQDDPERYPQPPPGYYHDYDGTLKVGYNHHTPRFPNMNPEIARLEAQVARLTAELQRVEKYIRHLGGSWPPPSNFTNSGIFR